VNDDLLDCPSCESDDVEVDDSGMSRGWFWVHCGDCGTRGPIKRSIDEADAAWNAMPRRKTSLAMIHVGEKIRQAIKASGATAPPVFGRDRITVVLDLKRAEKFAREAGE
jgi:hypothetical protein